ncbi:helix-turn-helix domain-containing protein [Gellertiella hungarica]|uniref:Chromosomal replication initiator DnaA C-terminal domain-containing protein n=1 Tax=Gellertiella hungarica TaxID=1572859 RepID=A0A7W6J2Q0_9HYPH|nr:helix-turn-helix domain-containing protein [Gellertiella hungarica]MBB4063664.1 hypothetical protein [Gellertiella hungarica]
MNLEFHARTYSSLAEQQAEIRKRRARLGLVGNRRSVKESTVEDARPEPVEVKKVDPPPPATVHVVTPSEVNFQPALAVGRVKQYLKRRCEDLDVTVDILKMRSRSRPLVRLRHQIWWELRMKFHLSYTDMAIRFGGLDHTTVMHGVHKFQAAIDAGEVPNPLTGRLEPKEG